MEFAKQLLISAVWNLAYELDVAAGDEPGITIHGIWRDDDADSPTVGDMLYRLIEDDKRTVKQVQLGRMNPEARYPNSPPDDAPVFTVLNPEHIFRYGMPPDRKNCAGCGSVVSKRELFCEKSADAILNCEYHLGDCSRPLCEVCLEDA